MLSISDFRVMYPEFSNTTNYPDVRIQLWMNFGKSMLNLDLWGDLYDFGIGLLVAHQLTINNTGDGTVSSKVSGSGIVSSKSVGGASASYDTTTASVKDAGFWNSTKYGIQFWQLRNMFGAVIQVS